jgi:tight adherence protein B
VKRLAAAAAALALLAALASTAQAAGSVRINALDDSRFPLVSLTVAAPTGGHGHGTPKFGVTENGSSVSGLTVGDPNQGAAIGLVLDASQSMRGKPETDATNAAADFASRMRSQDQMSVYAVGPQAQSEQSLTSDPTQITAALHQIGVGSQPGTALFGGITQAVSELATDNGVGRKAVIVLTDGQNTKRSPSLDDAVAAARKAGVAVYVIGLHSAQYDPAPLRTLAQSTGGKLFETAGGAGVKGVYARIGQDIRSTYRLQYESQTTGGTVAVKVTLPGAGSAATAYQPTNAAQVVPTSGSGFVSKLTTSPFAALILALGVGAAVLAAVLIVVRPRPEVRLRRRIETYTAPVRKTEQERQGIPFVKRVVIATERTLGGLSYWKHLSFLLEQGDLPVRAGEIFYIQLGAGFILGGLCFILLGPGLISLLVGVLGLVLPYMYVRRRARKRNKAFESLLADTLVTLAASLKAGHSFGQAMSSVVKDGQQPMAKEFGRVENEIRLGRSADDAMNSMAKRLGSKNFEFVVLAVNIQRQVGGSLAEILDMVADTVRSREQFVRKVKALTAMGRASAYVLLAMPFFLAFLIWLLNPAYIHPLFATYAGKVMIGIGVVSMIFGSIILRKIVNFKY